MARIITGKLSDHRRAAVVAMTTVAQTTGDNAGGAERRHVIACLGALAWQRTVNERDGNVTGYRARNNPHSLPTVRK